METLTSGAGEQEWLGNGKGPGDEDVAKHTGWGSQRHGI